MWQYKWIDNDTDFSASLPRRDLTTGAYIERLLLHWRGDMTAATAKTVAQLLALVQPFEVFLNGSAIISIRGDDLYALNLLFFKNNPFCMVASAATDAKTRCMGLRVPLYQPPRVKGALTCTATRVAVTGVDTEIIGINEKSNTKTMKDKYMNYVTINKTPAATGYGTIVDLPMNVGDLEGILFYGTTIPTATANTTTITELRVIVDGHRQHEIGWEELKGESSIGHHDLGDSPADWSIIDNYVLIDYRDDPVPRGTPVQIDINAGDTENLRMIPIFSCTDGP